VLKRSFDFLGAAFGLFLFSPLLVAIALMINLNSGPVFYRGVRIGLHGRPFRIFKFRTMVVNAEQLGASSTGDDDPRITRFGRFLRRHKLDELPQLLNVLTGDMSIVGPRPQVQWAVDLYKDDEHALLSVRPGITDYASLVFRDEGAILHGSADPDQDYLETIHPEKVRLGLLYLQTQSMWTDLKIILATVAALFGGDPRWCFPVQDESLHYRGQPRVSS